MKRKALLRLPLFLAVILAFTHASHAQFIASPTTDASSSQPVSNHTFSFSGTIPGQLDGVLSVTFSIYPDQQSTAALWTETQIVQVTSEKYTVMLGSTSPTGLPSDIFSADQAHWLGVQVDGSEKRFLLVSVPYAMKAVEAERLGGLLPSDFVTVQQLQSALQSAATPGTPTSSKTTASGPTGQAAVAGTPPQLATDFTDNNASEVLLVTQQGTGFAIHAITSSQAEAILAQNDSIGGTALHALATNATGTSIGVLAETASPDGIAGVFNNQAGGKILSLRNNGVEVASVDANGNLTATGRINGTFSGNGSGLTGIPPEGINATPFNSSGTIVQRDVNGGFSASRINGTFSGDGSGLIGISPEGINATPFNSSGTIVQRDVNGGFSASRINGTFSGDGSGLIGISPEGINATPFNSSGTIVQRDVNGGFSASRINGTFSGDGSGLIGITPAGINATPFNSSGTIVQRDVNGGFSASRINGTFSGDGSGLIGITPAGINATPFNSANTVVQRDFSGGFAASQISAGMFFGDGSGLVNVPISALNASTTPVPNSLVLRDSSGGLSAGTIFAGNLLVNAFNGTAIQGSAAGNAVGVQASTQDGIGLWAGTTGTDFRSTSLFLTNSASGKLISGGPGSSTNINETFSVSANGDIGFEGAMTTPYDITGTWIPSSLVKLTSIPGNSGAGTVTLTSPGDTSGAIGVAFGTGTFSRVQVVQSGQTFCGFDGPANVGDYVGISKTVAGNCADIGANFPTDGQQVVGRVLSPYVSGTARILLFQSELHNAAGGAGGSVTINTGAGLTGGPITSSGTISVADGGITAAKLAANAVTSANIADNSIPPAKITGTAATLGNNSFNGTQSMLGINVDGFVNLQGSSNSFIGSSNSSFTAMQVQSGSFTSAALVANGNFNAINASSNFGYGVFASSPGGTGLHGNGGSMGVEAESSGVALSASVNNFGGATGTAGIFTHFGTGKILSGRSGSQPTEVFSVDAAGNLLANGNFSSLGSLTTLYPNSPTGTIVNSLVKLTPNGFAVSTSAGDSGGAIGIAIAGAGTTGNVQIAYAGRAMCQFDNDPGAGDYVGISRSQTGMCVDLGQSIPTSGGQVIGRVISAPPGVVTGLRVGQVLLFNSDTRGGTVSSITAGPGLTGGLISSSGVIGIATGGVNNFMLQHSSITVVPGSGLAGGGAVPLGSSVTLSNSGVLSFNGRSGGVIAAPGDYSFAQIAGTAGASQLPSTTVYNNQSNTFTADQAIQGNVNANAVTAASANFSGTAGATSVLAVNDNGTSGFSFAVNSAHNPAALFTSSGNTVLLAGPITGPTTTLSTAGDLTLNGMAIAHGFSGDGSALTNVNAASVGGVAVANLATTSALGAETTARQSGDTTLQSNINAESTARASADTTLQNNINAETAARASADASLQANINSLSSASAQLAAANTFTAKQTLAASTTTSASLNVPGGAAPATPAAGDVWNTGNTLQYRDNASTTRSLVSTTQSGGLQMLKLTASISPANVSSQACAEQSFTVSGISTGDVLLSVLQPSTSSPGSNIAIGGFRVPSANTVAVQFCNVSRNNSTPTAGVYTFAFMR